MGIFTSVLNKSNLGRPVTIPDMIKIIETRYCSSVGIMHYILHIDVLGMTLDWITFGQDPVILNLGQDPVILNRVPKK